MLNWNFIEVGHFATWLALVAALLQGLGPLLGRFSHQPGLASLSISAARLVFVLVAIGAGALVHAFLSDNFSVLYVAQHSNSHLPLLYKTTALWGGHEGSLYLWLLILSLFGGLLSIQGEKLFAPQLPMVMAVHGWLIIGFLGLILFLSNPFLRQIPAPIDGSELNPLLQDPGMAFHPPMLYLGYVGFSVPFAIAIAALILRWHSEVWINLMRRWVLLAWGFLTAGIMLGGWWAYYELGWGGYWAWDPVENASFMPWLTATALVHSLMAQQHRGLLKVWSLFLIIATFSLSLLGTFLVRSGVLTSVHAFAVDPGRGAYILGFMSLVLVISFGLFLRRGGWQDGIDRTLEISGRGAMLVWNNVLFVSACVCVLVGTLAPLMMDITSERKLTVAAPYFNAVVVPVLILALCLMAVGPGIAWGRLDLPGFIRRHRWSLILAVMVTVFVLWWVGVGQWIAALACGLVPLVFGIMLKDLWVDQSKLSGSGAGLMQRLVLLSTRRGRFYAGMVVHGGMLVIALGLAGSGLFSQEKLVLMEPGDQVEIGGETLTFMKVEQSPVENYITNKGYFLLELNQELLIPEQRNYPVSRMPTSEAAVDSSLLRDIYLVLSEREAGGWGVRVRLNPLVQWIWWGGLVVIIGVGLSFLSGKQEEPIIHA